MTCYIFSSLAVPNIHSCNPLTVERHKIHVFLDSLDEVVVFWLGFFNALEPDCIY